MYVSLYVVTKLIENGGRTPQRNKERDAGSLFVVESVRMTVEMYFIVDRTNKMIRDGDLGEYGTVRLSVSLSISSRGSNATE
jgi:hypothetical protein